MNIHALAQIYAAAYAGTPSEAGAAFRRQCGEAAVWSFVGAVNLIPEKAKNSVSK